MRYIPHTAEDVEAMLDRIGVDSIDALFACVPEKYRLTRALEVPAAASEQTLLAELGALAARNTSSESHPSFLGAGFYAHFIPSELSGFGDALAHPDGPIQPLAQEQREGTRRMRTKTPARPPRSMVGPPGLEPGTVGLKVRCSTN